jgi:predicted ABC-type transport system involved in lysophospholipase L1 biosynthesis ATPase subunit
MDTGTPIALEDVSYSFGKGALEKQILFDVGTRIEGGEIVILTGPSGVHCDQPRKAASKYWGRNCSKPARRH